MSSLLNPAAVGFTDVRVHGARGDGATDDTVAIQAAIDGLAAAGGVVFLPAGTYVISQALRVSAAGLSIVGAGAGCTIIQAAAGAGDITLLVVGDGVQTCSDTVIRDLQFSAASQKTAGSAIRLQTCFRSTIERIRTQSQYRALDVVNSTETRIANSDLRDSSENGVVFDSTPGDGYDLYLTNVTMDNPDVSGGNTGVGLLWLGGENLVVNNCDVLHFQTGLSIAPPTGKAARFGFFSTAEFDTCSDNAVKVSDADGGAVVGVTLANCWAGSATNYGILIDGGHSGLVQGVRLVGCKVLHNGLAGVRLAGGQDVYLSDCDVVGNSQTAANARSGIEVAAGLGPGWGIRGCRSGNGYQQGSTQDHGISVDGPHTYDQSQIVHNHLWDNTNGGLALNSATITSAADNLGAAGGASPNGGAPWPIVADTPPALDDFTWVNQEGATAQATDGRLTLLAPSAAGTHLRALVQAIPSAPYQLTVRCLFNTWFANTRCGLVIYESEAEHALTWGPLQTADGYGSTQFVAHYYDHVWNVAGGTAWKAGSLFVPYLRLIDDGANVTCQISHDGMTFLTITTTDYATAGLDTPDKVGFFADSNGGGDVALTVFSWVAESTA